MPSTILNGRSVVIYDPVIGKDEIMKIHQSFQNTGIDPVAYYEVDKIFSGTEVRQHFASYFSQREIANLIFINKDDQYHFSITTYDGKPDFVGKDQGSWKTDAQDLHEALQNIYRSADGAYQKKNLLINDVPELNNTISLISGQRIEAFAYDMKVDPIAIPRFEDSTANVALAQIFKSYPFKYELVDPSLSEQELRGKGFFYILYYVHSTGRNAKELLNYSMVPSETASVSVTYPQKEPVLKNIPLNQPVYKFYVKMIQSGNVYLGTKWDADNTWEAALNNYIRGLKWELRID